MIEIGRINIITKLLLLSSHLELTRGGHLEAIVYIMTHVGHKYNSRLVYDPSYPDVDHNVFEKCDWSEFFPDAKEAIPVNAPEPKGNEVDTPMMVESDHAGDKLSCRLMHELVIYVNTAIMQWISKKQSTIKT